MRKRNTGKEQQIEKYYLVLNLKDKAQIKEVIKNYYSKLKKTDDLEQQQEICLAYCKICNERQGELYKYCWNIFLKNYQEIIEDPEKLKDIIKRIKGE